MKFEDEGLFIGLVNYPYYIDGKELFERIFKQFFSDQHLRDYLRPICGDGLDPNLYSPRAFRIIGSQGLAILSLIDEFAFCSRIFNSAHVKVAGSGDERLNQYKSVVLTGSSERLDDEDEPYLLERAKGSFLLKERRYPFIGIIRMKIDCGILHERGAASFLRKVKRFIDEKGKERENLTGFVVDTYDNDELTVVAFSDSLRRLDSYLKDIRRMVLSKDKLSLDTQVSGSGKVYHICSSCHMSYGYDIDFSFQESQEGFLPWNREEDGDYFINGLFESKPGHRYELYEYLKSWRSPGSGMSLSGKGLKCRRTVTGGSILQVEIPVDRADLLHALTREEELRKHLRRIKLTLNDRQGCKGRKHGHPEPDEIENILDNKFIEDVKKVLTDLGVSKIVRERLLSLLDLYNDCARNHLQTYYFKRLEASVQNILPILKDFRNNEEESLLSIERNLNEEVSALETAFYNRMHNKMSPNAVLEYGGGIHQFLQAFGFAYKELIRILSPGQAAANYSLVAGVSKESSMRTHTELNINHIIYPQLFCVTSWKEASNCTMWLFDDQRDLTEKTIVVQRYYNFFRNFIQNRDAFDSLWDILLNETDLASSDTVYRTLRSLLTPAALKYTLQDYIVYHFAFQRDFELMWQSYLKVFLQTPGVYSRRGQVKRKDFLFLLIRLLLVAHRETDPARHGKIESFLASRREKPFDYLLATVWFEGFDKANRIAGQLCKNLRSYAYVHVSEHLVLSCEVQLVSPIIGNERNSSFTWYLAKCLPDDNADNPDDVEYILSILNKLLEARGDRTRAFVSQMRAGRLDFDEISDRMDHPGFRDQKYDTPDNAVCLMNAFLRVIDELDGKGKAGGIRLHSVPRRREDGEIDFGAVRSLSGVSANLLADPIGGFIIPDPDVRKSYFACRTLLYRTLWDWSYRSKAPVYPNPKV